MKVSIIGASALGEGGIKEIIEYPLTPEEKDLLNKSAREVQKSIDYIREQVG